MKQQQLKIRIEKLLKAFIQQQQAPSKQLNQAISYALLNGGKRLRPQLVYNTAHALNTPLEFVDNIAMAVEMIHCYSLVHDDLPAMDDDDLRRGKATCHIKFNEAIAILAGDAMQSLAFELLSRTNRYLSTQSQLHIIHLLSKMIGPYGMAGGQALDLAAEGKDINLKSLKEIHRRKTGDLIFFCIKAVTIAASANKQQQAALEQYAKQLGLAFQVHDDVLDQTATSKELGKTAGKDISLNKATFPKLLGIETTQKLSQDLINNAIRALTDFNEKADGLRAIASYTVSRRF